MQKETAVVWNLRILCKSIDEETNRVKGTPLATYRAVENQSAFRSTKISEEKRKWTRCLDAHIEKIKLD